MSLNNFIFCFRFKRFRYERNFCRSYEYDNTVAVCECFFEQKWRCYRCVRSFVSVFEQKHNDILVSADEKFG